jgi:metal-responsive CopG/Arc/MetJ family transcriptional regulator
LWVVRPPSIAGGAQMTNRKITTINLPARLKEYVDGLQEFERQRSEIIRDIVTDFIDMIQRIPELHGYEQNIMTVNMEKSEIARLKKFNFLPSTSEFVRFAVLYRVMQHLSEAQLLKEVLLTPKQIMEGIINGGDGP